MINAIVNAINPAQSGTLVEIGPGEGAMTYPLLSARDQLTVVELDRDLVQRWQARQLEGLQIVAADALTVDYPALMQTSPLRVVGNLPYNISTPLIFHLLSFGDQIRDMVFMLQKEVVDRLCATPNHKSYGKLSIMTQLYCHAEALFDVPPECFDPPPKVMSAMVKLTPKAQLPDVDISLFEKVVTAAFAQRRKTLRNTLKTLLSAAQIEAAGLDPSLRAEALAEQDFINLTHQLTS